MSLMKHIRNLWSCASVAFVEVFSFLIEIPCTVVVSGSFLLFCFYSVFILLSLV